MVSTNAFEPEVRLPDDPNPSRTTLATVLISLGALIAVPSGFCTGAMGVMDILGNFGGGMFVVALIFGGIPFLIGATLMIFGWLALRDD